MACAELPNQPQPPAAAASGARLLGGCRDECRSRLSGIALGRAGHSLRSTTAIETGAQ